MAGLKDKFSNVSSYFKGLFKENNSEEIPLSQLDKWFKDRVISIENELNCKIEFLKRKISDEIKNGKENLKLLKSAELRNKKESQRVIQIMEGNRESYINKVSVFLDNLSIPEEIDDINNFITEFSRRTDEFNKSTIRSYYVLREFVEHEAYKVAQNIKKIDDLVKELNPIVSNREVVLISSIKRRIPELKNKIELKNKLKNEIMAAEEKLKDQQKLEEKAHENIKKFKKSREYLEYVKLNDEYSHFLSMLHSLSNNFSHDFSSIEKAFKKYSRMSTNEQLIFDYIENPAKALLNDKEFVIIEELGKINKLIQENRIELKDSKKDKSVDVIEKLNKQYLQEFLEKHAHLSAQIGEIDKEIDANKIVLETLDKLEKELKSVEDNKKSAEKELSLVKSDFDKTTIDALKDLIEGNINQLLECNFKLVV